MTWTLVVVCEVPEARLSVKDKTAYSDEVFFNTKVHKQVHIYNKQIRQTIYLTGQVRSDHLPSQGGLRDEQLPDSRIHSLKLSSFAGHQNSFLGLLAMFWQLLIYVGIARTQKNVAFSQCCESINSFIFVMIHD